MSLADCFLRGRVVFGDDGVAVFDEFCDASICGQVCSDADDELLADCLGESFECVDCWACAAGFHSSDCLSGGAHPVGEFGLGDSGFGTESIDEFTKFGESFFVGGCISARSVVGPSESTRRRGLLG